VSLVRSETRVLINRPILRRTQNLPTKVQGAPLLVRARPTDTQLTVSVTAADAGFLTAALADAPDALRRLTAVLQPAGPQQSQPQAAASLRCRSDWGGGVEVAVHGKSR